MKGLFLIEKILNNQDASKLFKINKKWLENATEERVYDIVVGHFYKYNHLPSSLKSLEIDEILPKDFWLHYRPEMPTDYYFDLLLERYIHCLYEKIKNLKPLKVDTSGIKQFLKDIYIELEEYFNGSYIDNNAYISKDEILEKFTQEIGSFKKNFVTGNISGSGFKSLDIMLGGGYIPSEIYVIVARLKMGKTMYLLKSAITSALSGKDVLFVSMEMDFFQIMRRLLSLVYRDNAYLDAKILTKDIETDLRSLFERFNFKFHYLNGMSVKNINALGGFISSKKFDIVFIDGAYLIDASTAVKTEWEKVKKTVESLKEIAMVYHIPIICTYQFNRAAISSEKGPDVEHIAYSDAIAQTAGAVISIVSQVDGSARKKKKEIDNNDDKKIKLFRVIANRHGITGEFVVNFDFDNMNFDEVDNTFEVENFNDFADEIDEEKIRKIVDYKL